jgi:hypothetical protein
MYAVVGCTDCGNVWLLSDPDGAETAQCSRCGRRHQVGKLRRFLETDDRDAARQARSAMLAKKRGDSEAFAEVDHVADLERQVEERDDDDTAYLAESGIDPDEVAAAGKRIEGGGGSTSRPERVREAVRALAEPTEENIVDHAAEHGVPPAAARDLLEKLRRQGEVSESRGEYRLL